MKHPMLNLYTFEQLGEIIREANMLRDHHYLGLQKIDRTDQTNRKQLDEIWKAFDENPMKVPPALRKAISRRVIRRKY